jgi:hypothetical protein
VSNCTSKLRNFKWFVLVLFIWSKLPRRPVRIWIKWKNEKINQKIKIEQVKIQLVGGSNSLLLTWLGNREIQWKCASCEFLSATSHVTLFPKIRYRDNCLICLLFPALGVSCYRFISLQCLWNSNKYYLITPAILSSRQGFNHLHPLPYSSVPARYTVSCKLWC